MQVASGCLTVQQALQNNDHGMTLVLLPGQRGALKVVLAFWVAGQEQLSPFRPAQHLFQGPFADVTCASFIDREPSGTS